MSAAPRSSIAVASGKGGTGKTTVAVHLALAAARRGSAVLLDLDVEAPDALGYFPGAVRIGESVSTSILAPVFAGPGCSGCGYCARACRFGAIVAIGGIVTIGDRACKGCGRCVAACPEHALEERSLEVGRITRYEETGLGLIEGRLAVGDIRTTAVIEAAKRAAAETGAAIEIRDCPPGATCPAVHAVAGADFLVLVAEPTAFSLHDLGAALEMAAASSIPAGVVINKAGFGDADLDSFCAGRGVPVIGRIPFSRERAAAGADARLWRDGEALREMDAILEAALRGAHDPARLEARV